MEASNVARICSVLLGATTVSRERLWPGNGLVLCCNPPQRASGSEPVPRHPPTLGQLAKPPRHTAASDGKAPLCDAWQASERAHGRYPAARR